MIELGGRIYINNQPLSQPTASTRVQPQCGQRDKSNSNATTLVRLQLSQQIPATSQKSRQNPVGTPEAMPSPNPDRPTPVPRTTLVLIISFVPIFLAIGFLQIVLGAWLVTAGFTALQAGTLISVQGVLVIVTSIPLGIISDIYGRKHLLTLGALAGAVGLLAFALTSVFWGFLVISAVLGFTEGATITTWNALLADLTDDSNRNKVFSLSFIMMNVTTGVGLVLPGAFPFLGSVLGVTSNAMHRETLLALGAASFITPLMLYLLLRNHRETHNPARRWAGLKNKATLAKLGFVREHARIRRRFHHPAVGNLVSVQVRR